MSLKFTEFLWQKNMKESKQDLLRLTDLFKFSLDRRAAGPGSRHTHKKLKFVLSQQGQVGKR